MTSDATKQPANLADVRLGDLRIRYEPHRCFACGELNEHGLRMALHVQDERCWSELALDSRYQGWEEIAHGGILSTILDEVMAWSLVSQDSWGVTARLTVSYHKPVRIGQRIKAEGWITEAGRRLSRTAATIADASTGEILASAEGVYVAAPAERREALKARYRFQLVPDDPKADGRGGRAVGRAGRAPE